MDIQINGVTYPLRASMGAWRKFEQATGVKVTGVDADDITRIPEMAYYFIESGCKAAGMKFDLTVRRAALLIPEDREAGATVCTLRPLLCAPELLS